MSRADFKGHGHFSNDQETEQIFEGLRGRQDVAGDFVEYYKLDLAATQIHPVYGEATGAGRVYTGPINVRCLHVTHLEGANDNTPAGFYTNDDLEATIPFDLFIGAGMSLADIESQNYLRDRVVYDRKVFRVTQLSIQGQIQERDIIVGLTASQCKPDELVDDAQFAQWSA